MNGEKLVHRRQLFKCENQAKPSWRLPRDWIYAVRFVAVVREWHTNHELWIYVTCLIAVDDCLVFQKQPPVLHTYDFKSHIPPDVNSIWLGKRTTTIWQSYYWDYGGYWILRCRMPTSEAISHGVDILFWNCYRKLSKNTGQKKYQLYGEKHWKQQIGEMKSLWKCRQGNSYTHNSSNS